MNVIVRGCKDDQADVMTDPQGETGRCVWKDEMEESSPLEEEYSP